MGSLFTQATALIVHAHPGKDQIRGLAALGSGFEGSTQAHLFVRRERHTAMRRTRVLTRLTRPIHGVNQRANLECMPIDLRQCQRWVNACHVRCLELDVSACLVKNCFFPDYAYST